MFQKVRHVASGGGRNEMGRHGRECTKFRGEGEVGASSAVTGTEMKA